MDIALVTGAATGVGLAVARKLVDLGCRVYGLGGNYQDTPFRHPAFHPVACDLASPADVQEKVKGILEREGGLYIVVNNAKVYPQRPLMEADPRELEISVRVNVLAPLLILRLALPSLQKYRGYVINICSTRPETARGGAAGAATDAAIHRLGEALFDELRGTGVRVTTLFPQTNRYRPADAGPPPRHNPQSVIDPLAVADAVERVVTHRDGNVITEIILRPLLLKEEPQPGAYVVPAPPPPPLEQASEVRERALGDRLIRSSPAVRAALEKARSPKELEAAAKLIDDEEDDGDFPEVDESLRRIDEEFGRSPRREEPEDDEDDDEDEDPEAAAAARLRRSEDEDDDDERELRDPDAFRESEANEANESTSGGDSETDPAKRKKRRRRRGRGRRTDRPEGEGSTEGAAAPRTAPAAAPAEGGAPKPAGAREFGPDEDELEAEDLARWDGEAPADGPPADGPATTPPASRPARGPRSPRAPRERREPREPQAAREPRPAREPQGAREPQPAREPRAPRESRPPAQAPAEPSAGTDAPAGGDSASAPASSPRPPRKRRNRSPEPPKRAPGPRRSPDE